MSSNQGHDLSPSGQLKHRLDSLLERMKGAAARSGRKEDAVQLVAVTKTVSVERINEALRLGVVKIGENRVQEAAAKRPELTGPFESHLIGPLQTNKAKKAVEIFDVIQSVDRLKLAEILDRLSAEKGAQLKCLVEVKISDEASKSGVPWQEADEFLASLAKFKNLVPQGIMGIGALNVSAEETRAAFRMLKKIFDRNQAQFSEKPVLSMGMTDDFEMAIEEGSTLVRIGRGLFGERENA